MKKWMIIVIISIFPYTNSMAQYCMIFNGGEYVGADGLFCPSNVLHIPFQMADLGIWKAEGKGISVNCSNISYRAEGVQVKNISYDGITLKNFPIDPWSITVEFTITTLKNSYPISNEIQKYTFVGDGTSGYYKYGSPYVISGIDKFTKLPCQANSVDCQIERRNINEYSATSSQNIGKYYYQYINGGFTDSGGQVSSVSKKGDVMTLEFRENTTLESKKGVLTLQYRVAIYDYRYGVTVPKYEKHTTSISYVQLPREYYYRLFGGNIASETMIDYGISESTINSNKSGHIETNDRSASFRYEWEGSDDQITWSPCEGTMEKLVVRYPYKMYYRRKTLCDKASQEVAYSNVSKIRYIYAGNFNQNYIQTYTATEAGSTAFNQSIVYYDGLGRPKQAVECKASPLGYDVVQPIYYDGFNRESRQYLPYVANCQDGRYLEWGQVEQEEYYKKLYGDELSYSETVYDGSPLNRVVEQSGVGKELGLKSRYTVRTAFSSNETGEVPLWKTDRTSGKPALSYNGNYALGTLYKTTMTDADGVKSQEYKDQQGRVVRVVADADGQKLPTDYVYDNFGNRCWVLPPQIRKDGLPSQTALDRYAYHYVYDHRNRMVMKKLPGAGPIYMMYDVYDRMVALQDGNIADRGEWRYTRYDVFNRPIETGTLTASRAEIEADLSTSARSDGLESGEYTKKSFPTGNIPHHALSVTYYDRYAPQEELPTVFGEAASVKTKGLVTRTSTREFSSDSWYHSTMFYDRKGRLIQTVESDASGQRHTYSTRYDFVGNVLTTREEHVLVDGTEDVKLTENAYDSRSRLLSSTTTVNGGTPATVRYAYDGLGRLSHTTYGTASDTLTTRHAYNIQGWQTCTSSRLFGMVLHYFDPKYATPCHNGNIAEWDWRQSDQPAKSYAFAYDKLGRLTHSTLYEAGERTDRFSERNLSYDGHGNLLTLDRSHATGSDTSYRYAYTGNQLTTLTKNGVAYHYTYDSNGNMVKDGRKCLEISYNLLNLPSTITRNDAEIARYRYLSDGTKLGVTGADGKGYTYMGSMIYSNDNGNLQLESTDFAGGRIYATTSGTEVRYHLCDHLGSPRVVLNESMEILEQNDYYAFGLRHENPEMTVSNNRFRYNGKEEQRIGALDVLDYGARHYDAETGRWTTVDPLAEKSRRWSPYNYCLNNPLIFVDLDGLKPVWNGKYGDGSKYIDDETNEEVAWSQVQNYMSYGNYDGPKELENSDNGYSNTITPFEVGVEWLSGKGEKNRTFVGGDNFTELLKEHDHVASTKEIIAKLIKKGILTGKNDYQLDGFQGVGKYIKDYSTLLTGGLTGNLAVTYLGSYKLSWSVVKMEGNETTVLFEVKNSSTIQSGTRPPVLGYTSLWQNTVGKGLNDLFSTGPASKTTQTLVWSEKITIK